MTERLMTEGRGVTIVVLDTRGIPYEDRPVAIPTDESSAGLFKTDSDKETDKSNAPCLSVCGALIWNETIEKNDAIRQLLDICCQGTGVDIPAAWNSLLEREGIGSTFIGEDVAIPHIRIESINQALLGVGVGKSGIFDPATGRAVRIMFLLLSPSIPPGCHVSMLARVSRLAMDDQWRRKALSSVIPDDLVHFVQIDE
jgi:two-component system sensor histidine kinase KdpD